MGARSGHSLLDRSAILIWGQDSVIQFVPSNNRPRICTERGKSPSSIAIQTVPGWEGESGHVSWSLFLVYVLRNHFHCVERKSGHGLEKVMKNFKVTFRAGEIAWLENACLLCKHQDPSSIPTLRTTTRIDGGGVFSTLPPRQGGLVLRIVSGGWPLPPHPLYLHTHMNIHVEKITFRQWSGHGRNQILCGKPFLSEGCLVLCHAVLLTCPLI